MKKLISLTMMCLLMVFTFQDQSSAKQSQAVKASTDLDDFYKYLGGTIFYPAKARMNGLQGNSIILFAVSEGKVKDLKIQTALGDDCDGEVLNRVLAYPNFAKVKNGKYALTTAFKLDGSTEPFINADAKTPTGYIALKIVVVGYASKQTASIQKKNDTAVFGNGVRVKGDGKVLFMTSSNKFKTMDKQPMVILDDELLEYDALQTIDPNKIESITILKDITAIAKYGNEAKNGVIIITSKGFVPKSTKKEVDTLKKN